MRLTDKQLNDISFGKIGMNVTDEGVSFERFTPEQKQLFARRNPLCPGPHAKYFYNNCFTDASVILDFYTNSDECTLNIASICLANDGTNGKFTVAVNQKVRFSADEPGEYRVRLCRKNRDQNRVTVYFPYFARISLKSVELSDGSFIQPVKKKGTVLVYGDSITHGCNVSDPSHLHISKIGVKYDCNMINQANAGTIHIPDLIVPIPGIQPSKILVAYGINDIVSLPFEVNRSNMITFYERLKTVFPASEIFTISPVWAGMMTDVFADKREPMYDLFAEISEQFGTCLIDGLSLVPHKADLFCDDRLHLKETAADYYAARLGKRIFE